MYNKGPDLGEFTYHKGMLIQHALKNVVKIKKPGEEFTLSSGKKSNFYIDCREAMLVGANMVCFGEAVRVMGLPWFKSVAGIPVGACPLMDSIAMLMDKNALIVRKKQKEHGTGKQIEGKIIIIDPTVLIVDDVLTTNRSLLLAYKTLIAHGLKPVAALVVVDREENDARNRAQDEMNIPVYSITTRTELMEAIKKDEEENEEKI